MRPAPSPSAAPSNGRSRRSTALAASPPTAARSSPDQSRRSTDISILIYRAPFRARALGVEAFGQEEGQGGRSRRPAQEGRTRGKAARRGEERGAAPAR